MAIMGLFPCVINISNVLLVPSISPKAESPKRCYFGLKTAHINLTSGLSHPRAFPVPFLLLSFVDKTS